MLWNMHLVYIPNQLGHSPIKITADVYGHLHDEMTALRGEPRDMTASYTSANAQRILALP